MAYPSRTIAFQAAGMMTSIIEGLQAHNEIRYTPAFMYADLLLRVSLVPPPFQPIPLIGT